jgi:ATP-binding cassette, subfamily B, bacterial
VLFMTVDWRMAAALAVFVLVLVLALSVFGARGRPLHRAYAAHGNMTNGEVVDAVANIWVVKAFTARQRERDRLASKFAVEAGTQTRSWLHVERTRVLHDLGLWAIAAGMLAWAIHLWTRGAITPGEVVMVSALTFRVLHGSREMALSLVGISQELAVVDEALAAIAQPHEVPDHPHAKPLVAKGGAIEFEEVSFAYPGGRVVFDRLSLSIPAGQKVGLVGASGAGKSTLVALVQRLDDVQRGRILVDGQALTDVAQDSLRAAIAVVPQEVSLFHRSVLENIRYGRPGASDAEVVAAAVAACADEFIRTLPDGYATMIGERGTKLSGGQRQRLGIARAILKDAPILVLDEATSALDSQSEAAIQEALARLMQGRTVLAIAHRLSTLAALDRIIVLAAGQVVEDGAPGELMGTDGVFQTLWRLQADSFASGEGRRAAA